MSKAPPRSQPRSKLAPALQAEDDAERKNAATLGATTALMLAAIFFYPTRAYPLESLIFATFFVTMTVLVCGFALASEKRAQALRLLGSWGFVCLGLFALWALWRWRALVVPIGDGTSETVLVSAPGRPMVIAYALMPVAMGLGMILSLFEPRGAPRLWPVFRNTLVVAGLGFALLGIQQYFRGYEEALTDIGVSALGEGGGDPLTRQSLEHAFAERRIGGTLGNPNVFAAWLALLAMFALLGTSSGGSRLTRVASFCAYLIFVYTIWLTGSRGGALTLIVATACVVLLHVRRSIGRPGAGGAPDQVKAGNKSMAARAVGLAGFTLLTRAAMSESFFERIGRVNTIQERLNYWHVALKVWAHDWLLGGSPGSFVLYYPMYKPPTARESRFAHSWFFHIGSETGVIGLALFAAVLVALAVVFIRAWRAMRAEPVGDEDLNLRRSRATEACWLATAAGVLAMNGLFEYSLQMREFLILFSLLAGGAIGMGMKSDDVMPLASGAAPPRRLFASILGGAAMAGCLAFAVWSVPRLHMGEFWEREARMSAGVDDHETAERLFARAESWIPDHAGYVANRASAIMHQKTRMDPGGRDAEAIALLERAQRMNPLSPRIRQAQSNAYRWSAQWDLAVEKINEAIELYPYDAGYRMDRAACYLNIRNWQKAEKDLEFIEREELPVWEFQRRDLKILTDRLQMWRSHPERAAQYGSHMWSNYEPVSDAP